MNRVPTLLPSELAARLRVSEKTLANWRSITKRTGKQRGPAWRQYGDGRIVYRLDDVEAFERRSTPHACAVEGGRAAIAS